MSCGLEGPGARSWLEEGDKTQLRGRDGADGILLKYKHQPGAPLVGWGRGRWPPSGKGKNRS